MSSAIVVVFLDVSCVTWIASKKPLPNVVYAGRNVLSVLWLLGNATADLL